MYFVLRMKLGFKHMLWLTWRWIEILRPEMYDNALSMYLVCVLRYNAS